MLESQASNSEFTVDSHEISTEHEPEEQAQALQRQVSQSSELDSITCESSNITFVIIMT